MAQDRWIVFSVNGHVARHLLEPGRAFTIGRSPRCTAVSGHPAMSRVHASIENTAEPGTHAEPEWRLIGLARSAPITVNGVRLASGIGLTLRHGDVIRMGDCKARFLIQAHHADPGCMPEPVRDLEIRPIALVEHDSLGRRDLGNLMHATESLMRAAGESELRRATVTAILRVTGFDRAALIRRNHDDEEELLADAPAASFRDSGPSRAAIRRGYEGPVVAGSEDPLSSTVSASLAQLGVLHAICLPYRVAGSVAAVAYVDTARPRSGDELRGAATLASAVLAFSAHCMMHLQRAAMEQRMAREQELMLSGTVVALVRAIDAKDAHTRGHSERVARLARLLAQAAELGADLAERAYLCGLVHDIGKIGVPEAILAKAGRLDDAERDAIREHPEIGHRILRQIPQLREVLPGVLDHHERWDGTGYPNASSGGTISLLGRVIAIADSVDAMTSSRVYRPACTIDQARLEVARCAGTHFDPDLARAFLAIPVDELESCLQRAPAPDAWDAGTRDAGTLDDSWAGGTAAA